jgi:hypothetical protein
MLAITITEMHEAVGLVRLGSIWTVLLSATRACRAELDTLATCTPADGRDVWTAPAVTITRGDHNARGEQGLLYGIAAMVGGLTPDERQMIAAALTSRGLRVDIDTSLSPGCGAREDRPPE